MRDRKVDNALTTLLKIKNIPTANAFSKYLRKHGTKGEEGMRKINKKYLKRFLKSIKNKELILDIDATLIEAHKNTAKYTQLPSNKKLKWLRADSACRFPQKQLI